MTKVRPIVGARVYLRHTDNFATVVPTGRAVPPDEVNVMVHVTGSIRTVPLSVIELVL